MNRTLVERMQNGWRRVTIYPDVIESVQPPGGPFATIKSHHNVGGLPGLY